MDPEAILDQARSGQPPSEWNVWPLRRDYVRTSAIKWGLLAIVGFAVLIPIGLAIVPSDFINTGMSEKLFATVLLLLLGSVAFGGLGIAIHDLWRLAHANEFWLVITPEVFVKAEPGKLTSTPLEDISSLTLKGVQVPSEEGNADVAAPLYGFMIGSRLRNVANAAGVRDVTRKRTRGNSSLAYRDKRTNKIITVCIDDSFDQMAAIYQLLDDRSAAREDKLRRAGAQGLQLPGR